MFWNLDVFGLDVMGVDVLGYHRSIVFHMFLKELTEKPTIIYFQARATTRANTSQCRWPSATKSSCPSTAEPRLRSTTRSTPSYGRLTSSQSSLKSENKFQKRKDNCVFFWLFRVYLCLVVELIWWSSALKNYEDLFLHLCKSKVIV